MVQGVELFESLKDVLEQLGLTDDEYAALKKAPCRERDQTDRLADLIARLKNRGAGIQASSYDLERVRICIQHPSSETYDTMEIEEMEGRGFIDSDPNFSACHCMLVLGTTPQLEGRLSAQRSRCSDWPRSFAS